MNFYYKIGTYFNDPYNIEKLRGIHGFNRTIGPACPNYTLLTKEEL